MKPIDAVCASCNHAFTGTPRRTFLGFQRLECASCKAKVIYPLTSGYRTTYWILSLLMVVATLGAFAQGRIGIPGIVGVLAMIALFRDRAIRRRVVPKTSQPAPGQV